MIRPRHLFFFFCLALAACTRTMPLPERDTLYQVSTLNAVMQGVYDGEVSLDQLRMFGDHGIGTFDALGGELVYLDGTIYNVKVDGTVELPPGKATTPFATVSWFDVDRTISVAEIDSTAVLYREIEAAMPTPNAFYLIRIDGTFSYIKARSVPRQQKPYPPLAEVVKKQNIFEFKDVEGTLVGVWCPAYAQGVNLAGFHLHFLTRDRRAGGHVFEVHPTRATVRLDLCQDFFLHLPRNENFSRTRIDRQEDYRGVER